MASYMFFFALLVTAACALPADKPKFGVQHTKIQHYIKPRDDCGPGPADFSQDIPNGFVLSIMALDSHVMACIDVQGEYKILAGGIGDPALVLVCLHNEGCHVEVWTKKKEVQ